MLPALLLLHLASPPSPLAPQAQQAADLVHASIRDFDMTYYDRALAEAEEAYRLDPLPQILFNIAQCHRALKHWEKAAALYRRYLKKLPEAPNRQQVEDRLAEAEYRAKLEALSTRPERQVAQPVVVVSAPESVPPAAVEASAAKGAEPAHSHAAAWVLGSVAVASLVFMVIGIVDVENYEAVIGRLNNPVSYPAWRVDDATATSMMPAAQAWEVVAFATGAVALGTGTAAVLTW